MRGIVAFVLVALVGGVGSSGCGKVMAKQDDGGVSDAAADAQMSLCTANAKSCGMDNALYECSADGNSLSKIQDCQYGCATDHCKECAASTTFCNGDDLVMCSSDGMITNPTTCVHGCQMNRCNTCDPGASYCDANGSAVTCGADGTPSSTMSCGTAGCAGGVCNQCQPNTTSCQGDTLVVCNAGGMVASTSTCALGCSTSGTVHCKQLVPSYGVPAPSGTLPNLLIDQDSSLTISNCSASPSSVDLTIGTTTTSIVGSPQVLVVTQTTGGPPICVVRFGTITVMAGKTLAIVNNASPGHVLSLQATGDIDISGTVSFLNSANGPSPGASAAVLGQNANSKDCAPGAGGAGAARAGGTGGTCFQCSGGNNVAGAAGGAAVTNITTRLVGGSVGGYVTNGTLTPGLGGKGGGALHLVSLTRVSVGATGIIALNGMGGGGANKTFTSYNLPAGGAGSGGTLVIEAPVTSMSTGGLAAANGGGGSGGCGYCDNSGGFINCGHYYGQSGQLSANRAAGGYCTGLLNGHGGDEANGAGPADGVDSNSACTSAAGGGGGASNGFIFLRGRAASSVSLATGSIVSPTPTIGAVTAN